LFHLFSDSVFPMDALDHKLLSILQEDSTLTVDQLSDAINLSKTACWRRLRRLQSDGIIQKYVAILDKVKVNVPVSVFVTVKSPKHSAGWLDQFREALPQIPEIVEAHRMAGDIDYMLRVVVPDIEAYDAVYKRLIELVEFDDVSSHFAMEEIKSTTSVPLDYLSF